MVSRVDEPFGVWHETKDPARRIARSGHVGLRTVRIQRKSQRGLDVSAVMFGIDQQRHLHELDIFIDSAMTTRIDPHRTHGQPVTDDHVCMTRGIR